jgi:hypothetical protein
MPLPGRNFNRNRLLSAAALIPAPEILAGVGHIAQSSMSGGPWLHGPVISLPGDERGPSFRIR